MGTIHEPLRKTNSNLNWEGMTTVQSPTLQTSDKLAQLKLRIGFYIICRFRRLNCMLYFMYFNVTLFSLYLQQTFVYHLLELSEPQVLLVINLNFHQKSPYDLQSFGPRPLSWHSPNVHPVKKKVNKIGIHFIVLLLPVVQAFLGSHSYFEPSPLHFPQFFCHVSFLEQKVDWQSHHQF